MKIGQYLADTVTYIMYKKQPVSLMLFNEPAYL